MMNRERLTSLTLWANRIVFAVLAALIFFMPTGLKWYALRRELPVDSMRAVLIAFYCCALFVGAALVNIELLLRNILAHRVFTRKNVKLIRRIRWSCLAVSLVCLVAAFFYLPLIFVVVIMAFMWLMISVVADVMDAAVLLREENDLTI